MYYYLSGILAHTEAHTAVIDCGGVGYLTTVSANTMSEISPSLGKTVKLYTHLAVREDAFELFGFATEREKSAFRMLIGVSGIGPKVAISILSALTPSSSPPRSARPTLRRLPAQRGLDKRERSGLSSSCARN